MAWQLGAAQTDLAMLRAEGVDWEQKVISFFRRKTKSVARRMVCSSEGFAP